MIDTIIFGYSKSAMEIARILTEKEHEFVILTTDEDRTKIAIEDGYDAHWINYNDDEELIKFGIGKWVKTLFCVSANYNKNLFITLSARNLDPKLYILSLSADEAEEKKMILAGANKNINPYTVGANRIYRLIKKPVVYHILDEILYHKSDIKIAELTVPENSYLIGLPLHGANIEADYDLMVLGIQGAKERQRFIFHTYKIRKKIQQGDIIVVIGKEKDIKKFKKAMVPS
jgi:voltage-gated potassium channel